MAVLDGKRVIVTGGSRGIGASAVRALAAAGAAVAILDVLVEAGRHLVSELEGSARFFPCDVSRRDSVRGAFAAAVTGLGGLDALVAAAGVETRRPAEDLDDDDLERVFGVNLRGTVLTNQAAFGPLSDAGGGRILNFASGAGMEPFPGAAHYSAAKAGVAAWTRSVAHEWGRHHITVNAIVPAMWTPMYQATRAQFDAAGLQAHDAVMATRIPLGGRLGDPDTDLAPVLVFLLGPGARFITGQSLCVDGGLSSVR